MFHYLRRYLHHVRRQSSAIKEMHALLFATLGTLGIVFLLLSIGSISHEEDASGAPVLSTTFSSPFSLFVEQVKQIAKTVQNGSTVEVINDVK